jgi:hypothetical protein
MDLKGPRHSHSEKNTYKKDCYRPNYVTQLFQGLISFLESTKEEKMYAPVLLPKSEGHAFINKNANDKMGVAGKSELF